MTPSATSRTSIVLVIALLAGLAMALWLFIGHGATPPPDAGREVGRGTPRAADPLWPSSRSATEDKRERIGEDPGQPESITAPAPGTRPASLAVWLEDADGRRPAWGGVLLWRAGTTDGPPRKSRALHDEPALFADLEPGSYRFAIEPESLSSGWVPAHPQGFSVDLFAPESSTVELGFGEEREESLLVRAAGHLFGTVFGPDGSPVPYATVRLHATARYVGRGNIVDVDADELGNYSVDLTPGRYLVHVLAGPSRRHPLLHSPGGLSPAQSPIYRIPRPVPRWADLDAGETVRHDIHFGRGHGMIRGRVVDERGEPVPGLRTLVYPHGEPIEGQGGAIHMGWAAAVGGVDTDADGRFVLDGLEAARYGIQTGLNRAYSPRERPGTNVLGDWPVPVYVRVADGEEVDVGEIRVWRSRPFVVRGRVVSLSGRHYTWETVQPIGWRRRTREMNYDLYIEPDGTFSWHVETPEGPVLMRARDAKGTLIHEETFHPEPDGEEWREVRVP